MKKQTTDQIDEYIEEKINKLELNKYKKSILSFFKKDDPSISKDLNDDSKTALREFFGFHGAISQDAKFGNQGVYGKLVDFFKESNFNPDDTSKMLTMMKKSNKNGYDNFVDYCERQINKNFPDEWIQNNESTLYGIVNNHNTNIKHQKLGEYNVLASFKKFLDKKGNGNDDWNSFIQDFSQDERKKKTISKNTEVKISEDEPREVQEIKSNYKEAFTRDELLKALKERSESLNNDSLEFPNININTEKSSAGNFNKLNRNKLR